MKPVFVDLERCRQAAPEPERTVAEDHSQTAQRGWDTGGADEARLLLRELERLDWLDLGEALRAGGESLVDRRPLDLAEDVKV